MKKYAYDSGKKNNIDYQNNSGVNMQQTKTINQRCKLLPSAFYTESEVTIPNLSRILAVSSSVKVTSTECVAGEVRVSGKVNYNVIYLSTDGSIDCAMTSKDFLEKIIDKGITPLSIVLVNAIKEDTEWYGVDVTRLKTTVVLKGYYIRSIEINCADCETGLYTYDVDVDVETSNIIPTTTKEVSKEVEIVGGIDRVMCQTARANVKTTATANGIVYVEGDVTAAVIYSRDNKLYTETVVIPFNTELSSIEVKEDSLVSVYGDVSYVNVILDGDTGILVESTVSIKGIVTNLEKVTLLKDAYAIDKEIKLIEQEYCVSYTCCRESLSDKISTDVRLTEKGARAIAVTTQPSVSGLSVSIVDGELVAEGVVNARVIYLDEEGVPYSTLIEAPFQLRGGRACAMAKVLAERAEIISYSSRIRMSDEIEFSANLLITVEGQQDETLTCITSYDVLGDVQDDEVAISLYIAKEGESLFSVAKALRTTEERILSENPDLKLPLEEGTQIIIYQEL